MKKIFFAALCKEQLPEARLEKLAQEGDVYVCILDDPTATPPAGCGTLSPRDLLGEDWKQHAFWFEREEFVAVCEMKALARLATEGTAVICLRGGLQLPKEFSLTEEADTLGVLGEEKTAGFVLEDQSKTMLFEGNLLIVMGGPQVSQWLAWCQEKAQRTLQAMNGVRVVRCRVPELLEQWSFFRDWRRLSLYFGCRVRTMPWTVKSVEDNVWKWDFFEDGTPIIPILREYYAQDYYLRDDCQGDPFAHPENFFARTVVLGEETAVPFTAAMLAVYQMRIDLWQVFPDVLNAQRKAFTQWYLDHVQQEFQVPPAYTEPVRLAQQRPSMPQEKKIRPFGVNLCGLVKGDFGLGESCRSMARTLEAAKIPYTIVDSQAALGQRYTNEEFAPKISNTFPYRINLFDINGNGMEEFFRTTSHDVLKDRYNIGYWAWELPEAVPEDWEPAYEMLDEVWTCSDFSAQAIQKTSPIPVCTIPHTICVRQEKQFTRADFGLPEQKFLFLMMYDVSSVTERKNPEGAIQAFLKAFADNEKVCLVIKINAPMGWDCDSPLLKKLAGYSNIYPLVQSYSKPAINRLLALCDAVISLHRSEGFGLVPAETMALGRPVVITNWSGSTMYAKPEACCPVPYTIVELNKDYGVYKKGSHWAEPDIDAAAQWMKKLVEDPEFYRTVAARGKQVIEEEFSPAAVGKQVQRRLAELGL